MSYKIKKTAAFLGITALVTFSVTGCSFGISKKNTDNGSDGISADSSTQSASSPQTASSGAITAKRLNAEDMFTARDKEVGYDEATSESITLSDGGCTSSSDAVKIDGNTVTVTEDGSYMLSGSLSDGQIRIDATDAKIQLVLNGVNIHSSSSAAIYVANADKVFLTLAENSENTLASDGGFVAIDENNIDGAIFSKSDLSINGAGTLNVTCEAAHGIVCKKDLCITTGTYNITSTKHAISGKNSVRIADGTFHLVSGSDAIHGEHQNDDKKGFVYIAGGNFTIKSTGDGIDSSSIAQIEGGTFQIGSSEAKAVKGDTALFLSDADITASVKDDGLHTDGDIEITSGTYSITTEDDGIHAGSAFVINGGTVNIPSCEEGVEATTITVNSGEIDLVAKDDGFNASGGKNGTSDTRADKAQNTDEAQNAAAADADMPQGSDGKPGLPPGADADASPQFGARPGAMGGDDPFASDESCSLTINGGITHINAQGDGLDSNGAIRITGGEVYIDGPTDNGNGAIDCGTSATITGGTVVAVGSSGMAENFGSDSTQGAILVNLSAPTGEALVLKGSDGKELISYKPEKTYDSVIISTPDIRAGGSYTLSCGGTDTSIEMTDTIYGEGSGMGGGPGRGMGGHGAGADRGIDGDYNHDMDAHGSGGSYGTDRKHPADNHRSDDAHADGN